MPSGSYPQRSLEDLFSDKKKTKISILAEGVT